MIPSCSVSLWVMMDVDWMDSRMRENLQVALTVPPECDGGDVEEMIPYFLGRKQTPTFLWVAPFRQPNIVKHHHGQTPVLFPNHSSLYEIGCIPVRSAFLTMGRWMQTMARGLRYVATADDVGPWDCVETLSLTGGPSITKTWSQVRTLVTYAVSSIPWTKFPALETLVFRFPPTPEFRWEGVSATIHTIRVYGGHLSLPHLPHLRTATSTCDLRLNPQVQTLLVIDDNPMPPPTCTTWILQDQNWLRRHPLPTHVRTLHMPLFGRAQAFDIPHQLEELVLYCHDLVEVRIVAGGLHIMRKGHHDHISPNITCTIYLLGKKRYGWRKGHLWEVSSSPFSDAEIQRQALVFLE